MLLMYAVAIGLVAGLAVGGRLDRLGSIRFAWALPAIAGLLAQVALFTEPVSASLGAALPACYVASTAVVFAALLRNVRLPGVPLVALGAAANLVAIIANGGSMPVSADALAAIGRAGESGVHANTVVAGPATALAWLGDVIPVPPPIPAANVVSIGDVLIALGAIAFLVLAMRETGDAADARPGRFLPTRGSPPADPSPSAQRGGSHG